MAQRPTLTEKQLEVLRWIAAGCPDGVMDGYFHRISAAALRSRGLVQVSGRGRTWKASVTKAGEDYITAADGPDPPVARQANISVTQQLVNDVIAAGGTLRVKRKSYYDPNSVDYVYRAQMAERYDKVPEGTRLVVDRAGDDLEIRLEDAPHRVGDRPELQPVAVPEQVGRYHPAARRFRDLTAEHQVSRQSIPRAARILHAIAKEAERHGWVAEATESGGVGITADEHSYSVRIEEEGVHARGRWEEQVERYRQAATYWSRHPDPDRQHSYPTGP